MSDMDFIGFFAEVGRIFLPRRCAVCGRKLLRGERFLCLGCAEEMPLTYFWLTPHNAMADKLNARLQETLSAYEPYTPAAALFYYKEGYKGLTQSLKYDGNVPLGRYLGETLGRRISSAPAFDGVNVIVPVPLHRRRRLKRGYNQSEVIARAIASRMVGHYAVLEKSLTCLSDADDMTDVLWPDLSVCPALLRRVRHTKSQTTLDAEGKAANVKDAFAVDEECLRAVLQRLASAPGADMPVAPSFLLVDDVFTSGSTLSECIRALRLSLCHVLGDEEGRRIHISAATLAAVGD